VKRVILAIGILLTGLLVGVVVLVSAPPDVPTAGAAGTSRAPTAGDGIQPELGLPGTDVVAFGASPAEGEEIWAYAKTGPEPLTVGGHAYAEQYVLLRRTGSSNWQPLPLPAAAGGESLAPSGGRGSPAEYGPFAGQATASGGVVLLSGQNLVVRDPGGEPKLAPAPKSSMLGAKESLLPPQSSQTPTVPYAAIEDSGTSGASHTGVLIAPYDDGSSEGMSPGVLHFDGESWSREPIGSKPEMEKLEHLTALALSCAGAGSVPEGSSPQNCWLLASAQVKVSGEARNMLLLYRRTGSGSTAGWQRVNVPGLLNEESKHTVSALPQGAQMLTATAQGLWVDFKADVGSTVAHESDVSELVTQSGSEVHVTGPWCHPTGTECELSLGGDLPSVYRSFAWAGSGEDPGTRIITGLPDHAMLELAGGSFRYEIGPGGADGQAPGGAAFEPPQGEQPQEGLIADGVNPVAAPDGAGQAQAVALKPNPEGSQLAEEAVPFRRPLYAVAQPPGTVPGRSGSPAVAVGEMGEIARYTPATGWLPEALYNSEGTAQTQTALRGVAWPEPGRIYAVGDSGTMWLWRAETGLWEPDPAKPPNFIGNLQAIAFSPTDPQLGYAAGRQGALLRFGKSWEQVPLPAELKEVNFTSITFAGGEALATFRTLENPPGSSSQITKFETGGVAVEEVGDGLHWHVDAGAAALLSQLPRTDRVLSKISGLSDSGVVAAGPGKVIERESQSGSWRFSAQPLPEAANIAALAAYRDSSGSIRALVSVDLDERLDPEHFGSGDLQETPFGIDLAPPSVAGEPTAFLGPDLLPNSGYLLRETAAGWSDMQHDALPAPSGGGFPLDSPVRPDPVLALLAGPSGESGLAVGGRTGDIEGRVLTPGSNDVEGQTAAVQRFPAGDASQNGRGSPATIPTRPTTANFVVGGQAACAQLCANYAAEGLGPDAWLEHALQVANGIAGNSEGGLSGFLYTGGRLSSDADLEQEPSAERGESLKRDLTRYANLLGSDGGQVPVYAAPSEDLTGSNAGSQPFSAILSTYLPGASGGGYYAFPSQGKTSVLVVVLSFMHGELEPGEESWLIGTLGSAKAPVIVMGNDSLGLTLPEEDASSARVTVKVAADAAAVSRILVEDGASAYFFDYPGGNVEGAVSYGTRTIPAFGTGTLGYVKPEDEFREAGSLGSSGFLLAEVETGVPAPNAGPNAVKVTARVVPNIGSLAIEATGGTLLQRSHVALFEALARRPSAGSAIEEGNGLELSGPDPYDKIPFFCQGANCADQVPQEYTFSSSNPEVGNFVAHDPTSREPLQVLLGANQLPVPDSHSGLFCAFNPGTTTVSVTTAGLTYSLPVTVLAGSVEYPCGTVPLKNPPPLELPSGATFKAPQTSPSSVPPTSTPQLQSIAPPPAPVPAAPPTPHQAPHPAIPEFGLPFTQLTVPPIPAIVPAPATPGGEPTPPSGSSQVFQTMAATKEEREDEVATEMTATRSALAYDPNEGSGPGPLLLMLVVVAAGAGTGIRRGRRSQRPVLARAGSGRRPPWR
jgi:hypothetical protein